MKAELTAERLREVLDYDPETGVFTWRVKLSNRALAGAVAGTLNQRWGYTYISIDSTLYRACRLAWMWMLGEWPNGNIDHLNGVRNDDRFVNLRDVSQSVNMQNIRGAHGNSHSGLLGASMMHNRRGTKPWAARIVVDGRPRHLGYFSSGEEAHEAYIAAKRKLHEGCTI